LGKPVTTATCVDINLFHDVLAGQSVTGVLHLVNNAPADWFAEKQAAVETETHGSEFVGVRTATEQIVDLGEGSSILLILVQILLHRAEPVRWQSAGDTAHLW
jgi:hypothetical protein